MIKDHPPYIKNDRDEWVPAIPLPWESLFGYVCDYGHRRFFFTKRGYRGHYALEHILGL